MRRHNVSVSYRVERSNGRREVDASSSSPAQPYTYKRFSKPPPQQQRAPTRQLWEAGGEEGGDHDEDEDEEADGAPRSTELGEKLYGVFPVLNALRAKRSVHACH